MKRATTFWRGLGIGAACLVLAASPLRAEEQPAPPKDPFAADLEGISGEAMLEMVKELASDEMLGRKTGWKGGPEVEEWIAAKFAEFGLHPADQSGAYLEPFHFPSTNIKAPIDCTVADKKLTYGTDYSHLEYSGSGKIEAPVVFCGYGIHRPDLEWDDYAGVDVKGKVVIAIRGLPKARAADFDVERFIGYKSATAADRGAVGFLLVENEKPLTGTIQARFHRGSVPGLWLSHAAVDHLLASSGKNIAALKAERDAGKPGTSFETGAKVSLEVHSTLKEKARGHNVIARIDGRDPDLKREIVLVGAHADHLGVDPNGDVFNGADDNASGTAVLIHLADILSLNKFRPKRTIVFCAFGAEEQGLHGSTALATNSPFHGNVVAVLNMDMVGQGDPVVSCGGVGAYPAIGQRLRDAVPPSLKDSVHFSPRAGKGSDHYPFYDRGIPAFAVSTRGKHPNYHTTADDVGNIKAANLEATAQVVGRWVAALAAHDKPLWDASGLAAFLVDHALRPCTFTVVPRADKTAEAAAQEVLASKTPVLRTGADLGAAHNSGERPFLLRYQDLDTPAGRDPTKLAALAEAGFRVVSLAHAKPVDDAYLEALSASGMVADLTGVPASDLPALVARLHGAPAVWFNAHGAPLPPPIEGVLFVQRVDGPHEQYATCVAREDVCAFQGDGAQARAGLIDALQKSGLDLEPGTPGRQRARAWLGGALVRLLTK